MNISSINSLNFKGHVDLLTPMDKPISENLKGVLNVLKNEIKKNTKDDEKTVITVRPSSQYPDSMMVSVYDAYQNGTDDKDREYLRLHNYSSYVNTNLSADTAKAFKSMIPQNYRRDL